MKFRNERAGTSVYLYTGPGEVILQGGRIVQPFLTTAAGSSSVFETRDVA